ncbi:MAG TPA: alpha/beta fold hydrolase [Acidimicrobiia bacterium]|nr:alpha/beta fold hydrolase [Acidimicrobiia bacterium]
MPFARVNGTMLFYREAGDGPLAVFIHGFPLDHSVWLDQLEGLAHVRRCVTLDLRGFGRSDPITDEVLTMEMLADDVAGLVEALGAHGADVVGLSMGGYVALALWEIHPTLVRSLTLIGTRATADTAEGRAKRDAMIDRLLEGGRTGLAEEMLTSLLGPAPSARARARLRSMIEGTRYETLVAAILGMRDRADRTALLPSIEVPALVIGGEEDTLIPSEAMMALADEVPGARRSTVAGAGHLTPIERPDKVNEALIELFEGRKVIWWQGGDSPTT